jgi:hypothetical protein
MLIAVGLFAFAVASSPMASGQSNETPAAPPPVPMVTDRPTDSASAVVVPRHTFQLELGYKFSHSEDDSASTDVQVLPDLLARYGISHKVELRLAAGGWTVETVETGTGGEKRGFSDISLGTKIALVNESGRRSQMGILVDVSLPVGDEGFSNEYVVPKVLFLRSHDLTDRHGLTYNIGPSFVTSESNGESDTHVNLNYAVAVYGSIGGGFNLFGEFYGAFAFGSNGLNRHSFQAGTTILLRPLFQIDIRGGVGLVNNVPNWLVGAGLAFRVPR